MKPDISQVADMFGKELTCRKLEIWRGFISCHERSIIEGVFTSSDTANALRPVRSLRHRFKGTRARGSDLVMSHRDTVAIGTSDVRVHMSALMTCMIKY
ncbi:hypothetical protein DPMN_067278 [Dreissena polymorpha]|uniref:Uncharacterized protein n=1 Tax=Dreissena polymorpha TaxID=45954 RepID=A0A9D3YZE8_DREPO|nr:hypothetical protein DPMN_067278 [Dreissena polymorpha]